MEMIEDLIVQPHKKEYPPSRTNGVALRPTPGQTTKTVFFCPFDTVFFLGDWTPLLPFLPVVGLKRLGRTFIPDP
jgi:hypothetical protein